MPVRRARHRWRHAGAISPGSAMRHLAGRRRPWRSGCAAPRPAGPWRASQLARICARRRFMPPNSVCARAIEPGGVRRSCRPDRRSARHAGRRRRGTAGRRGTGASVASAASVWPPPCCAQATSSGCSTCVSALARQRVELRLRRLPVAGAGLDRRPAAAEPPGCPAADAASCTASGRPAIRAGDECLLQQFRVVGTRGAGAQKLLRRGRSGRTGSCANRPTR